MFTWQKWSTEKLNFLPKITLTILHLIFHLYTMLSIYKILHAQCLKVEKFHFFHLALQYGGLSKVVIGLGSPHNCHSWECTHIVLVVNQKTVNLGHFYYYSKKQQAAVIQLNVNFSLDFTTHFKGVSKERRFIHFQDQNNEPLRTLVSVYICGVVMKILWIVLIYLLLIELQLLSKYSLPFWMSIFDISIWFYFESGEPVSWLSFLIFLLKDFLVFSHLYPGFICYTQL